MRWTKVMAAALAMGLAVVPVGSAVTAAPGQVDGECPQPWEPWYQASTYPAPPDIPDLGTDVLYAARAPDTDGDGQADTITTGDYHKVKIARGDGTITLVPGAAHDYVYVGGYGPNPGDLDGDGRDELIIGVDQQGEQYILPGTTAPGTHEIADVGVFLDGFTNLYVPTGDQDGDGGDDLIFETGFYPDPPVQSLFSGVELVAPGGGASVTPPNALATFAGTNVAAANFDPPNPPTILIGSRSGGSSSVSVQSSPPVELRTPAILGEYTGGTGPIGAWMREGQRLVTLSPSDRGGSALAVWNLDDPCGRYVAPPTTTTTSVPPDDDDATPAQPVEGASAYTG